MARKQTPIEQALKGIRPQIQCDADPGCREGALCAVDGLRLCLEHYKAHFTRKARENSEQRVN